MPIVNILEAKTQLSRLVESVASGAEQEIIIARNGKPAARLVPLKVARGGIRLGLLDGMYSDMSLEQFNAADEEIAALMNKTWVSHER